MTVREASHAGSWYSDLTLKLSAELDGWLAQVPTNPENVGSLPRPGARLIIAPTMRLTRDSPSHAGYSYSGPAAAWAYKSLDLSNAKRVFLLGPSHHVHLLGLALSAHTSYDTPLGPLRLDLATINELQSTGKFETMTPETDSDEHSLEMHLPYIYKVLSRTHSDPASFPPLTPILVGATNVAAERSYGALLAPYLADPSSVFIVSSDFCHWGTRFNYTYYLPLSGSGGGGSSSSSSVTGESIPAGHSLRAGGRAPTSPPIHESIGALDRLAMDAMAGGSHARFTAVLRATGNTVCGRHPIGVAMAAVEALQKDGRLGEDKGRFRFIRYERSSECVRVSDSSVSYASAFAVI